ncbi:MAG: bifunctional diguanylate cyclase/phosphodiesterase [Gammaproteobacteria bacterium]|nr:bifunctional diguanylate cyclase/phosphodiesterase [Gammaproteobacteria bacterium]MDH3552211.1 bifunctional diguanylate cyclase/phosphodiesterase [Gammaproteobacteria bacterium]
MTNSIRDSLKRTVRSRQSHSVEIEDPDTGLLNEFIFVAQGRDRVLMIVRDLSEQKLALSRARQLAYMDDVTGLPNREFLFRELQKITDVQRLKEGRAAMICLHVGQFDDHGYVLNSAQQDEVLKELAARLTTHLRGSNDDSVTDYERYSVAARTDYRQFSVVLPYIESGEDAEAVVERLINDLAQPATVGARTVTVRACGGVALFPQDGMDPAALYENAIGAMEDARNDPSAPFKFHSGTVRLRTLQRKDLEVELKTALEHNDYALNFLPIVDAETGMPTTVEALLRWPETILGTQPTRKIVRVAERTGLILPIGQWVLRHACEQLQAWHRAGHTDVRIAVNLSAQELVSDGIAERIEKVLAETDTSPCDLDLEIKEHMLFREVLTDYATCKRLKALGIRIVVDDYGVGACSLAHLSQSPVGALKIDNTFVSSLETSDRDKAACAAAIAMAKELGLDVVAEGVETEFQAQVLRDHGCRYLQGFLFGTPMTDSEILRYLNAMADRLRMSEIAR